MADDYDEQTRDLQRRADQADDEEVAEATAYFTADELEYLTNRLDDARTNIKAHESGILHFPSGEMAQILTLRNVLEIALKLKD